MRTFRSRHVACPTCQSHDVKPARGIWEWHITHQGTALTCRLCGFRSGFACRTRSPYLAEAA